MIALARLLFALTAISFISGCASVTRGTKDTLVVETDPAGADVHLSTGGTGKTPTSFQLPRKSTLEVFIEKEGYEPLTVHVSSQISSSGAVGMAGNVLVGGLIGVGVDSWTGAAKDLRPNPIKVTLVPRKKDTSPTQVNAPILPGNTPVEPPGATPRPADVVSKGIQPGTPPVGALPAEFKPAGTQVGAMRLSNPMSSAQLQDLICSVLLAREWDVTEKAPNHVIGHIKHRSLEAVLTLVFDSESIQIYCEGWKIEKESGAHIRPQLPEGWIKNIQNDLTKRLPQSPTNVAQR